MSPKTLRHIIVTIHELYPQDTTELYYHTPFQLLVAVILSAQCTDQQVNKVTKILFDTIVSPKNVLDIGLWKLNTAIESIWLHNVKSKYIYALAQLLENHNYQKQYKKLCKSYQALQIYKKYNYVISDSISELVKLPWVGIKTAKVVWSILYNLPVLAVDTHVHRIVNRIWIVSTTHALQTDQQLTHIIPKDIIKLTHHSMVFFGRYICKAIKPLCSQCPLTKHCSWYRAKNKKQNNKITTKR
jgi:endonuclease-3